MNAVWAAGLLLAGAAWAQNPRPAMEASLAKQKESLRIQAKTALPVVSTPAHPFFLVPWPEHVALEHTDTPPVQPASSPSASCDPLPAADVDRLAGTAAQTHGIEPDLLKAVMRQESGFRPCAVSPKGAMGLMQLMPATAGQFQVADPFDPAANIDAGARYLKQLLDRYGGDLKRALSAYNAGPARVDKQGVPAIAETQEYLRRILMEVGF